MQFFRSGHTVKARRWFPLLRWKILPTGQKCASVTARSTTSPQESEDAIVKRQDASAIRKGKYENEKEEPPRMRRTLWQMLENPLTYIY
jgi:hypothetical protein